MAEQKLDLYGALGQRYCLPKFAFATEVPNGTSFNKSRSCDALAIGCWKSVGISIIGHEIKCSRSDWQREMQEPAKAEAWKRYCNEWYLVAYPGVAKLEELPASWGLMEPAGSGLKIRKPCEINRSPEPIPITVLAGIARRLQSVSDVEKEKDRAYQRGYSDAQKRYLEGASSEKAMMEKLVARERQENERMRADMDRFAELTGVSLVGYSAKRVDDAAAAFKALELFRQEFEVRHVRQLAQNVVDAMDQIERATTAKLEGE